MMLAMSKTLSLANNEPSLCLSKREDFASAFTFTSRGRVAR